MLKRLIIVRHADYVNNPDDKDPEISGTGSLQAEALAAKIKRIIGDESATIWTSEALRACQTAAIIFNQFERRETDNVVAGTMAKLWSDAWHQHDFNWLREQIEEFRGTNLIIVTHLEYVNDFPRHLGFREYHNSGYAQGVLITFTGEMGKVGEIKNIY